MVKLLCFDLDDTLYDNKPVIQMAEATFVSHLPTIFNRYKRQWSVEKYTLAKIAEQKNNPIACENLTELRIRTLHRLFDFIEDRSARDTIVNELVQRFLYQRSHINVDKLLVSMLERLQAKYLLVAATNGNVDFYSLNIAGLFSAYYSPTIGYRAKPHPHMLWQAMEEHELSQDECVLIGDSDNTDGEAANNAGIKFIRFAPFKEGSLDQQAINQLEQDLINLN